MPATERRRDAQLNGMGLSGRTTMRPLRTKSRDDEARDFFRSLCWPDGEPLCPRCGNRKIYTLSGEKLRCSNCKYTFQTFSGRWINNGALTPDEWLRLVRHFVEERTVHEIMELLGLTYNTVYKALTTVRFAILAHAQDAAQYISPATGLDSYIKGNRLTGGPKTMHMDTTPVYGILRKDDMVFVDLIPNFQAETVFHLHMNFYLKLVRAGNMVYSDPYKEYESLILCGNDSLPYDIIRRNDDPPHIDAVGDEFWQTLHGRLRRFRGISCQRFPLYLKELEFRFNNRSRSLFEPITRYLCDLVHPLY